MSSSRSGTVAVLGLGTMGGRVAAHLVAAGATVTGYDPSATASAASTDAGVDVRETAGAAVRGATVAVLSLPGPPAVTAAANGPLREMPAGSTVIDLSTIDPGTARAAHEALAESDISYVDAPVLGRPERCGYWTLPTGGPSKAVEQARSLLEGTVAARVVPVGDVGAGCTIKVLNNLMFGAINAVTAEAFTICERAGVDPDVFAGTIADSGAATVSGLFKELAAKVVKDDYSPTFELALLRKDNRLALGLAQQTESPGFVAACVDQLNTLASRRWPHEDTAAMYKLYRSFSAEDNP